MDDLTTIGYTSDAEIDDLTTIHYNSDAEQTVPTPKNSKNSS